MQYSTDSIWAKLKSFQWWIHDISTSNSCHLQHQVCISFTQFPKSTSSSLFIFLEWSVCSQWILKSDHPSSYGKSVNSRGREKGVKRREMMCRLSHCTWDATSLFIALETIIFFTWWWCTQNKIPNANCQPLQVKLQLFCFDLWLKLI